MKVVRHPMRCSLFALGLVALDVLANGLPAQSGAPACNLRVGHYKFVSKDKLRRNELVVRKIDAENHIEFRGTWRATIDDDGSGVHVGQIGGTAPRGSCRFQIAGDDHSCAISVTLHRDGRVVARQAGHCLGFGDQVDVSGTYVKVQRKGPP